MDDFICDGRGWYKTYRQIDEWEWYKTPHMFHIFSHLLNKANFEEKRWKGTLVKRGQCITSVAHLSAETGISTRSIRTCLERLKSTNEITSESTNQFTIITIVKYDTYQSGLEFTDKRINKQTDKRLTNDRQTTDNNEEVKKLRSKKIFYSDIFLSFWSAYPDREGKKINKSEALVQFNKLQNGDREQVISAAKKYGDYCRKVERSPKDAFRWLRDGLWKEWVSDEPEVLDPITRIMREINGNPANIE